MQDAKFSKKFTLELLHVSIDKSNSKVALMQVNNAGFSMQSSLSLDRYINDDCIDLVAVSESQSQMSGFKNYDMYKSRVQTHGCVLFVNNHLKSYELKEPCFENVDVVIKSGDTEDLVGSIYDRLSDETNF